MEDVVVAGQNITRELEASFVAAERAECDAAQARMTAAAKEREALGDAAESAVGRLEHQVDPYFYHYWGQREGYEIWNDRTELERFAKDTPSMRVRQRRGATISPGIQFGEDGKVLRCAR